MNQERLKEENTLELLLPDYKGETTETDDDVLHDCLNHIGEGFIAVSLSGNFKFINHHAAGLIKRLPAEVKGTNIWKAFPQLVHSEFYSAFLRVLELREPVSFKGFFCDRKTFLKIRLYPAEKGISIFLKGIDSDKEAENPWREGHLLRILIDNLPDYIYVKDAMSRHIINNKANVELLGAGSEKETLGKTILDYSGDLAMIEGHLEDDQLVVRSGQAQLNKEEIFVRSNGEKRWLLTTKVPFKDEKNNVLGLVGISRDITDRKRIETQLKDLNQSLEQKAAAFAASNRELEQFAYVASHDLQEPLRMISSFLQLLKKEYQHQLDKTAEQYIYFAVDGAERMKNLIMDLLEYSKLGSNIIAYEPTSLDAVVDDVLSIFQETVAHTGASIEKDPLPLMRVNGLQISQLFQNLIGNALKYCSERSPHIRISVRERDDDWLFSVEDNGIGIEARFFERIFTIFQRLHSNSKYTGTGIGLALCKKIVEKHGGSIWVESEPGKGSTFHFTISKKL